MIVGACVRPNGWEARLAERLREAAARPYDAKTWNCARFAHACAQAVSGRSIPFRRRGSLETSVGAIFPPVQPSRALRGDVVLGNVPKPSLGVCIGSRAAFLGRSGILTIPMWEVTAAWRV